MYSKFIKRILDFTASLLMIIILSPLLLALMLTIRLTSKGGVIFCQRRIGRFEKTFNIYKFRTMRADTPANVPTHQLKNAEGYITPIGKFMRKTSLDELPQLFNILKGEMSFCGPRPALWNQYDLTSLRREMGVQALRPGLTGLAQISGRDELPIPVKVAFDAKYLQRISLLTDIKIIIKTFGSVIKRDGIVEGKKYPVGGFSMDLDFRFPFVSVIVPTYRRTNHLKRALLSLLQNTFTSFEIIVVDDNADTAFSNEVYKIISALKLGEEKLKYIQNPENKGSAESRNIGIRKAIGAYITFLDDDDEYLRDKIQNQLKFMLENNLDYSITDLKLYNSSNIMTDYRKRDYIAKFDQNSLKAYHFKYHLTGTDTFMFRREYLEKIGGFPPIDIGDEFYLMDKAIEGGGTFGYLPECGVKAYTHGSDEGLSAGQGKIDGENMLYDYKQRYFNQFSSSTIKYIKMRHFSVLAYAYLGQKKPFPTLCNLFKAFICSPVNFIKLIFKR